MTEVEILLKEHEWLVKRIEGLNQTGQVINVTGALVFSVAAVLSGTTGAEIRIAVAVFLPILWTGLIFYSQVLRWETARYREYVRVLELAINKQVGAHVTGWEIVTEQSEERPYAYRYFLWYWFLVSGFVWLTSTVFLWTTATRISGVYWLAALQTAVAIASGVGVFRTLRWRGALKTEVRERSLEFFRQNTTSNLPTHQSGMS